MASAAAKISGAGLKRPTWELVTAPSTRSASANDSSTSSRSRLVFETSPTTRPAARRRARHGRTSSYREKFSQRPHCVDDRGRAAVTRPGLVASHGRHDGLRDDLVDRVVMGVVAPGATRLDGVVGAALGLVPAVDVEAQAEAGARSRGSLRR